MSEPSSVVLAFKTAILAPEILVSIGPSPHQWFWHAKQRLLDQILQVYIGPGLRLLICECKTASLDPE